MKKIKLIIKRILKKRPLVCLTANNIYIAKILDDICDIVLVGDSLGMTVYGESITNKVTIIVGIESKIPDIRKLVHLDIK